jgi:PhnB protein
MMVQPYLFFNGNCEEALQFYCRAFRVPLDMLMRFKEAPDPPPPGMVPEGWDDKVMHASFRVGDTTVMASDGCTPDGPGFRGFSLSISLPGAGDTDPLFAALADGGKVDMPLGRTFWSPRFGILTDRYGVQWMISVEPEEATAGGRPS